MNRHLTPGCKTAILINGIPASGKSTITRLLAETFSLPVLTIDGIKEPFMARLAPVDRPMNRQLGQLRQILFSGVARRPRRQPRGIARDGQLRRDMVPDLNHLLHARLL